MARGIRQFIIPLYLLFCLLLGGSTRAPWSNMALQLGAVAILSWSAMGRSRFQAGRPGTQLAMIIAAMVGLVIIQLIPLPPGVWSALPGRDPIAHGFDLLGQPRPWLTLSLAPYGTMASALWLLPPLAILAGTIRLGAYRELWMAIAIVQAALIGVTLGALQLAGVDDASSPWYIYEITNAGVAVGFFANANHMAILLVATLPFLVAMYGGGSGAPAGRVQASAGRIAVLGGAMMMVLVGIALNGSIAGFVLGALVFGASIFVRARLSPTRVLWAVAAVGLGGLIAIAVLVASPLQSNITSTGVENDYLSRYTLFTNSLRAAADHVPVGSGVGSFADVYPAYENPVLVDRWYVNHVHNDYIELALETGLPGILLIAAFVLWWIQRVVAIWRAPTIDRFARAATIASGAIMLHSLVDFPLRTTSISALFAFCVAIMVGVRRRSTIAAPVKQNEQDARHLSIGRGA